MLALFAVGASVAALPLPAAGAVPETHVSTRVVLFESAGSQTQHVTGAATVGEFLKERGITPGPRDYVNPSADTAIVNNVVIQYAPAVAVTVVTSRGTRHLVTTASDVGALLEEQGIALGAHDVVHPSLDEAIVPNATVRVTSVLVWAVNEKRHIAARTIHRIDFSLPRGSTKVLAHGEPGLTETMVRYTRTDGKLDKLVVGHRLLRKPRARIIAEGVGTYDAIARFARRGLEKTSYIAANALDMVATAYTAACSGCSGYTASGYRAGQGIVAVDPRVIPLGARLYIPGYGFAVAGDTGGAIVGNRIDLGFNSLSDALSFGRRAVKVYRLH